MRAIHLFTAPEGQKMTEKVFGRLLLSSICSILLCMACLASTTWAWFTVSMNNRENLIQIAQVCPVVDLTNSQMPIEPTDEGYYVLTAGEYELRLEVASDIQATEGIEDVSNPVYVILSVNSGTNERSYWYRFESYDEAKLLVLKVEQDSAKARFSVSWVEPAAAEPALDNTLVVD